MSDLRSASALFLVRLQRLLTLVAPAAPDKSEIAQLTRRLNEVARSVFSDGVLTSDELQKMADELDSVRKRYDAIASEKGLARASGLPETADTFRSYAEAAQLHFSFLAGNDAEYYRGGLLREYRSSDDPSRIASQIALDVVTSASTSVAISKLHLMRAAISLEPSDERRRHLLDLVEQAILDSVSLPLWREAGVTPAIDKETVQRHMKFSATVALRRLELPSETLNTNAMFPNRPLAGWEQQNSTALSSMLDDLSRADALFLDALSPSATPLRVAMKIELNMGIEGPPSVTDPVVTGGTLFELLERGYRRGVLLHFTVGDSCGVENAPVGRTSMDIMRETGNYHYALKAGLRFTLRRDEDGERREAASRMLDRIAALESATPPVFFAGPADRITTFNDIIHAENLAAPWVRCVDYDEEGFVPVRTDLGALGLALWGTRDFHVARPWVEADHRVHVTRGCSTHLFAGWTGALKGLVGLHALGLRPADQALNEIGQTLLDMLVMMMHLSGFNGIIGAKSRLGDITRLTHDKGAALGRSADLWKQLGETAALADGWKHWVAETFALERELRQDLRDGLGETAVMAKMRRVTRGILDEADRRSPGFRDALWAAVADGTRSGLLAVWRVRSMIPANMRDARMGMRIGILAQLPWQAELVVQGLPKIGIGGGPDAYETVRDTGILAAGTDEVSIDLAVLRAAEVPGNPWEYNWPIYGALQFGRGPACWDEISVRSAEQASTGAV